MMLLKLQETLPEPRRAALREELKILEATAAANSGTTLQPSPARLIWD
jgi:hypothetical protein